MKIRTVLLSSAAVMISGAAAHSADAPMIEPEPVEYVRVCDAYGAGWFFIPGTETCIKFDGDVRVQYDSTHYHDDVDDVTALHEATYRARLNVRAKNETEYGTLSSRFRLVAESESGGSDDQLSQSEGPGATGVVVDTAIISIAGFKVGFDEDYWTHFGYYEARFDGKYSYSLGLFAEYTYAAEGLSATVGFADGDVSGESGAPDAYGRLTYTTGGLALFAGIINDSSASAQAYGLRADYDFGNGLALAAWYDFDHGETDYVKGHIWGVTGKYTVGNVIWFAGHSVFDDQFANLDINTAGDVDGSSTSTTFGFAWDAVPGLRIQPEYTVNTFAKQSAADEQVNHGRFSLRIERSF